MLLAAGPEALRLAAWPAGTANKPKGLEHSRPAGSGAVRQERQVGRLTEGWGPLRTEPEARRTREGFLTGEGFV